MDTTFILHQPARPENIGATARALKTMGFTSLVVVDTDAHRQAATSWTAHGSEEIVANIVCYKRLEEALEKHDFIIAATARPRKSKRRLHAPRTAVNIVIDKVNQIDSLALLFGCEAHGLPNWALEQADLLSRIPTKIDFPSINLAHAVMIYAYELTLLPYTTRGTSTAPADSIRKLQENIFDQLAGTPAATDTKLRAWLLDSLAALSSRDIKMLHTLTNDLGRNSS